MCVKPMSFMPFNVFSLTRPSREVKELSSKPPEEKGKQISNLILQLYPSQDYPVRIDVRRIISYSFLPQNPKMLTKRSVLTGP